MQFSQQPRTVRINSARTLAANIRKTARDFARVSVNLISPELPEPHFTQLTDAELENFLRRNSLTDALQEYLTAQNARHC